MYSEISYLLLEGRRQRTDDERQKVKPSVVRLLSSVFCLPKVGFPIRKSADQSFFAAPHGLSQRSTSFIASQRQGIHRMPLRHLIALIINAHPLGSGPFERPSELAFLRTIQTVDID